MEGTCGVAADVSRRHYQPEQNAPTHVGGYATLSRCLWVAVLLQLAGCSLGPRYHRPDTHAPAAFRGEASASTNSFADLPWWQVFHDDTLQALIRTALTNNFDVRIAATRVEQARAVAAQARSQFFPLVGYSAEAGRGKNSFPGGGAFPGRATASLFEGYLDASWEIDLWGRIRRLNESARAQFFAAEEARRAVTVSLIAQLAQDYFQLLALDRELTIAQAATNSYGQSLKLFNQRLTGGVASKLETSSAEALLAAAAANMPDLERQIALVENQINLLLGQNPGPIARAGTSFEEQTTPDIPAGLPSALLERRPDVREAEQNLRSANAQIGVVEAEMLPQLSLTALFGRVSPELSALTGGGATAWSVGAGLAGPLFQGGRLMAQYRQAKAARDEAALQYQATVLNAFHEVAGALITRDKLTEARAQQARAVAAYEEASKIALERYRHGQSSYYEVLQAQQLLFPAANTLVQTHLNQLTAVVQLYRALGGGWQVGSR